MTYKYIEKFTTEEEEEEENKTQSTQEQNLPLKGWGYGYIDNTFSIRKKVKDDTKGFIKRHENVSYDEMIKIDRNRKITSWILLAIDIIASAIFIFSIIFDKGKDIEGLTNNVFIAATLIFNFIFIPPILRLQNIISKSLMQSLTGSLAPGFVVLIAIYNIYFSKK